MAFKIISSEYSVFPTPLSAQGLVFVQYVLTVGDINDYAVYVGVVNDYSMDKTGKQKTEALSWVAANGNKLTYREALGVFPMLIGRENNYRD